MGTKRPCPQCGEIIVGTLDRCPKDGAPLFSEEIMARVGRVLRDHEILGVIGEGGMGVVYRAQHVVIEKAVAIKVLHDRFARQKEMVEQFVIEAKAASRIRNPNIIDVTDFGTTPEGLVFLVMEYLDGESLEERLERVGRLPVFEAVNIATQVARGLAAAHELGIVHRDLKPANIFLCRRDGRRRIVRRTSGEAEAGFTVEPEGSFDLVKLLDFGVAKFMDLGPSAATRMGVLCGTPHYLSPEQAQEKPASERSDLYALGAVLYEMVTGQVPFGGASMLDILTGHVAGVLTVPSQRAPEAGIDRCLDSVVVRCLEKDPDRRFGSADELGMALRGCVADRAFLRDAHRLEGIERSGIDLSEGTAEARAEAAAPRAAEVAAGPREGAAAGEESLDGDDASAVDAMGLRRARRYRAAGLAMVAALLLAGVAVLLRQGSGSSPAAVRPATSAPPDLGPALEPPGLGVPVETTPPSMPVATRAAGPTLLGASPQVPPTALSPTPASTSVPRAAPVRPRLARAERSAAGPVPAAPSPRQTGVPQSARPAVLPGGASEVAAAAAAGGAAVDVEALLRDAEQARRRHYYALAIDKARRVLKVEPGRQAAHEIIATSACDLGDVADARQAVRHLDTARRQSVLHLCEKNGVKLD